MPAVRVDAAMMTVRTVLITPATPADAFTPSVLPAMKEATTMARLRNPKMMMAAAPTLDDPAIPGSPRMPMARMIPAAQVMIPAMSCQIATVTICGKRGPALPSAHRTPPMVSPHPPQVVVAVPLDTFEDCNRILPPVDPDERYSRYAAGTAIFVALYATGVAATGNADPDLPSPAAAAAGSHLAFLAGGILSLVVVVLALFVRKAPATDAH